MKINASDIISIEFVSSEDIIYYEFKHKTTVDINMAKELVSHRLEFSSNLNHYLVVDVSNVKEVSSEAKEYFQDPEGGLQGILGSAFIAFNPVSVLLANIFIKTKRNKTPSKCFTNKGDALKWIKELKEKI